MSDTLNGFLIVDKPAGLTSHDVVARIRRAARAKTGHAGTLDPFATGVLVVCLGSATRLAEWASEADKRYRAEVRLGVETDTHDSEGHVVAERPVETTREEIEAAVERFLGPQEQVPPAFSAIKIGGQRSYRLAREGRAVAPPPRLVCIRSLTLIEWQPPRMILDVTCSKGTYVRALARDLGQLLGCGAHLSGLRRLASGCFGIEQAHSIEQATAAIESGQGDRLLLPLETPIVDLPAIRLAPPHVSALRHGQPVEGDQPRDEAAPLGRAHAPSGQLVAIVQWRDGAWWPKKVLAA